MLTIGEIPVKPAVLLAPMAGLTDRPFRDLVSRFGAGLVVSEMIATAEMLAGRPSVRARAEIAAGSAGTAVQIAGREPGPMAEAARRLAGEGAPIIDINMGCPAKKVTSGASGSALMREPDRALSLIEAVAEAVGVPVTVKMRLGWDDTSLNAAEIAHRAEAAGVAMITVHGRTRCQFYRGTADWDAVSRVVAAVRIPVVVNGDILDTATARTALDRSGAAGVMVGRGATGRPWALAGIAAGLAGRPVPERPRGTALAEIIAGHLDAHCAFHQPAIAVRSFRKHLDAYVSGLTGARALRDRMMRETDPKALARLIRDAVPDHDTPRLAA